MLGLPDHVHTCLFDLDGVLTRTSKVHATAWKDMFDDFLRHRAEREGTAFVPFDAVRDYEQYVDGRPRADGIRTFLAARGIVLPDGGPDDGPGADTVSGLGSRKNELLLRTIQEHGVEAYDGSVAYVRAVRDAGMRRAVVSSSANCQAVLAGAGIEDLFDERIDGVVARERRLHGKPAPDTYLAAARLLGVEPAAAAVFEDALAGVEAGRAGRFGFVVGVDRLGQADELRRHGADVVVGDLAELMESS
ncbi:HAD family hydrolase [Streptomyces sp. SYSU K217416]